MAGVKRCKLRRGNAYEFAIYSSILIETLGQCVSLERLSHSTGDEACLATGTAEMVVSCCLVLVWFTVAASHPHFHPPSAPAFSLSLSLSLSHWMRVCVGCWWWWWHSASFSSLEMMTMRRKIHGVSKNAPASASNCVLMCCIYLIFLFVYFSAVLCVCVVFLWALVAWNKNKIKWLREIKCLFIHSFIHSFIQAVVSTRQDESW